MDSLDRLVDKLCESSRRNFHNVYEYVTWPKAVEPESQWFMTPELCSLHGTEAWDLLDERAQKRLAFHEAVNFFSLNIHGESALMQGLALRLYGPRSRTMSPYLHHFLDEENKHSVLFGTFCERYGKKIYPDRKVFALGEPSSPEHPEQGDFLFFAKVLVFEEIVDRFNLAMSKDTRLHPLAVAINHNHHIEEARHLAFGRHICADLWAAGQRSWPEEERRAIIEYLQRFFLVSWREYYNPDVYRDAGLETALHGRVSKCNPWQLQSLAWEHPASVARRAAMSEKCKTFFAQISALPEVMAL
ncbi:MAG TPA: diiron oxygenase [Polyangiaceae bacterium]|nr:diiron oxygenase [Polyangiaceae bacterium]